MCLKTTEQEIIKERERKREREKIETIQANYLSSPHNPRLV